MSEIIQISGCKNPERIGDVIFVHGLGGDARNTWHPENSGTGDQFWPAWLGQDLPDVGVWSLQYEVEPYAWKGSTMPLTDRATNVLALLEAHGLGSHPIVFIAHSLGGLLVKQMLRHAQEFNTLEWTAIVQQIKGIIFLSTPHSGSDLASWISYLRTILPSSVSVEELRANDPRLRNLNLWYRNNVQGLGISTQIYCETQKTRGILVVNETSADPGIPGVIPVPMDTDHISICKPKSKSNLLYIRSKQFIIKNFE